MRINAKIMAEHAKANIARQSQQLMQTQVRLSSGKRINKPSDDPVGMTKVLDYRTTLTTIAQYRENILTAKTRISFTEGILGQVSEFIEEAKRIAGDPNTDDKTAFAQTIRNIRQQVLGLANYKYGGNALFAGHLTDTVPFDPSSPYTYRGDAGAHAVVVGEGITVSTEADGSRIFIDGGDSLFQVLDDIEAALIASPYDPAAVEGLIDPLFRIADRVKLARSGLATDHQRLERTDGYWQRFGNAVENMRQSVEDTDITRTAVDLQVQKTAYEVLLASTASIVQTNLLNFLK